MVAPPITFRCPHCGILLTVSAQLAGVEGPCPRCVRAIHAPTPQMNSGFPAPFPGLPSMGPFPRPIAAPQSPLPPTVAGRPATPASVPITPRVAPPPTTQRDPTPTYKEKLEPSGHRQIRPKRGHETRRIPKRIMLRSMMPLLFAGATAVLILGVMKVLKKQGITPPPPPQAAAATTKAPETTHPEKSSETTDQTNTNSTASSGGDTKEGTQPVLVDEASLRPSAASEALVVLESFLRASSLEERIPIIETKEPEGDLTGTVLAAPLPSFRNLVIDSQESFPLENIVDFYFTFEFVNKDGSADPQTVVVRRRGGLNPRVLADPFLDLYGGRLAAYAAKPHEKGQSFHAIVYPLPSCNDLRIPDRQKKLTLRLYSHEHSPNVTLAYASRISKIGERLTNGSYDLSFGKPKACVILLGWNTQENPDAPYLEALDVSSSHWNP